MWEVPCQTVWNECRIVLKRCHSLRTMLKLCWMTKWNQILPIVTQIGQSLCTNCWVRCRVLLLCWISFGDWPPPIAKRCTYNKHTSLYRHCFKTERARKRNSQGQHNQGTQMIICLYDETSSQTSLSVSDNSDISWKIKKHSKSRAFSDLPPTAKRFWVPNYNALNSVSNPGYLCGWRHTCCHICYIGM